MSISLHAYHLDRAALYLFAHLLREEALWSSIIFDEWRDAWAALERARKNDDPQTWHDPAQKVRQVSERHKDSHEQVRLQVFDDPEDISKCYVRTLLWDVNLPNKVIQKHKLTTIREIYYHSGSDGYSKKEIAKGEALAKELDRATARREYALISVLDYDYLEEMRYKAGFEARNRLKNAKP